MRATRTTTPGATTAPLKHRLRYAFDNTMAAGTPALMAWLAALTLGFILIGAALLLGLHSLGGRTPAGKPSENPSGSAWCGRWIPAPCPVTRGGPSGWCPWE